MTGCAVDSEMKSGVFERHFPGLLQCFVQDIGVADVIRQQQDQRGIERVALVVVEIAVRVDQMIVEVVRPGEIGAGGRKSVVWGTRVSVGVDRGGGLLIKQKKK